MSRGSFHTADLNLAAFLLAKNFVAVQVDDSNPRHLRFEFVRGAELEALERQYSAGIAEVNAVEFAEALSEVRSHVWRAKDNLRREEERRNGRTKSFDR